MANWAELIPDLLSMIAKKVEVYEDFVAFRGVCRSWRSAGLKNNYSPVPEKQVPWLLLAGDDDDQRDFYSLTNGGMVHTVDLPEVRGKRIFSSLGWLITIDKEGEMQLLHPLSRLLIPLPGASKFSHYDSTSMDPMDMLWRAALSASPTTDGDYILMIAIGSTPKLAYWRPGNNAWITIQTPHGRSAFEDVVYFGGQFHGITCRGDLVSVDMTNNTANLVGRIPTDIFDTNRCYLVQDSIVGHLIAVVREILHDDDDPEDVAYDLAHYHYHQAHPDLDNHQVIIPPFALPPYLHKRYQNYWTNSFRLFSFDSSYNCHVINDFGSGRSLFVGQCAAVLLSHAAGGRGNIRPNCIYFTDDANCLYSGNEELVGGGGIDMGVYCLQHKEVIKDVPPLYHGNKGRSPICPPLWVLPSF